MGSPLCGARCGCDEEQWQMIDITGPACGYPLSRGVRARARKVMVRYVHIGASVDVGTNKRAERANNEVSTKRGRFVSSSKRGGKRAKVDTCDSRV